MGNGAVKTIVLLMALVVLSVIVGAQVSDSAQASVGAFATIGVCAALFGMLLLGSNCWHLIFLLPPFIYQVPGVAGSGIPLSFLVVIAIGLYWTLMWVMGFVRFTWYSLPLLDSLVLILFFYMVVSFYRHPVAMNILGFDYDYVGAKDYAMCLSAMGCYVTYSFITWRLEPLLRCLKWTFYISFSFAVFNAFEGMLFPDSMIGVEGMDAGEVLKNGRFSFFAAVGMSLLIVVYGGNSFRNIMASCWKLLAVLLGVASVMMSGWRSQMMLMVVNVSFLAIVKRELAVLAAMGVCAYACLFLAGASGTLEGAPYGLQRVLTAVPGIQVSQEAVRDAEGSSEIRIKMWKNALDPRTGLIKDYIWGDGFQISRASIKRDEVARMRNRFIDQQQYMERSGSWHNAWVTYLQRLGIVGLVLIQTFLLVCVVYALHVTRALLHLQNGVYALAIVTKFLGISFLSCVGVWTVSDVFGVFGSIALVKVLYCLLREHRLVTPMFSRRQYYIPLIIREQGVSTL